MNAIIRAAADQPQADIPEALRSRLAGHNVPNLRAWAKLSPAVKRSLFGITGRHRELLDELARTQQ